MQPVDVAIVGAGVIGAAIAYELARTTKLRVVVFEGGMPGCGASGAAAGVLAVASGRAARGALFDLRRRSGNLFPELVAELEARSGLTLDYTRGNVLSVAVDDATAEVLAQRVHDRRLQAFECGILQRDELRERVPQLSERVVGAAWFADDACIDSQRFVAALVRVAASLGVQFRTNCRVKAVTGTAASAVLHLGSETFETGIVVIAAGVRSPEVLQTCGLRIPIRSSRGEMLALRFDGPRPSAHALLMADTQVVVRGTEWWVGSTSSYTGPDPQLTATGVRSLRRRAEALLPAIRAMPTIRAWAGLRPCATIRRPIIARIPCHPRLILASGHHRNGVLLAPMTARLVREIILDAAPTVSLAPFGYRRH